VGPIISRFENRGFKLAAIKLVTPSKEHLEKHYEDLSDKPFFPGLIACTSSSYPTSPFQTPLTISPPHRFPPYTSPSSICLFLRNSLIPATDMGSGPVCAMVWEGRDAVKTGRAILGATNPLASSPGTIRGDYAIDVGRNVCHGSDSVENAKKEIALWFKDGEVQSWKSAQFDWIYEKA